MQRRDFFCRGLFSYAPGHVAKYSFREKRAFNVAIRIVTYIPAMQIVQFVIGNLA